MLNDNRNIPWFVNLAGFKINASKLQTNFKRLTVTRIYQNLYFKACA